MNKISLLALSAVLLVGVPGCGEKKAKKPAKTKKVKKAKISKRSRVYVPSKELADERGFAYGDYA